MAVHSGGNGVQLSGVLIATLHPVCLTENSTVEVSSTVGIHNQSIAHRGVGELWISALFLPFVRKEQICNKQQYRPSVMTGAGCSVQVQGSSLQEVLAATKAAAVHGKLTVFVKF